MSLSEIYADWVNIERYNEAEKQTSTQVKVDTVYYTGIMQGKFARLAEIVSHRVRSRCFCSCHSIVLVQTHVHDTVRDTISSEYLHAGLV